MSDKLCLVMKGHNQETAMREVVKICLGAETTICEEVTAGEYVTSTAEASQDKITVTTAISFENKKDSLVYIHTNDPEKNENQNMTNAVKTGFYRLFTSLFGRTLPWGSQTGIRPALSASRLLEKHGNREAAICGLMEEYSISREKAELATEVAQTEERLLADHPNRGISA